jgi:hypothetical protein
MTELERRSSVDSAISISSLHKNPIVIYQAEKLFSRPPIKTIRVSSRTWTTLSDATLPQQNISTSSPMSVWNPSSETWQQTFPQNRQISFLYCFPSKWSKKQNLHCIVMGLLVCVMISLALGLTLHFQRSETTFDGSTGPTGSAPSAIPGPALPVLGFIQHPGNASAIYFGVSIDWKYDDPAHFNSVLKYPAAIHDTIFTLGKTFDTRAVVNSSGLLHEIADVYTWSASLVRGTGAVMGMTVIPSEPLYRISETVLSQLADKCREINLMGIPILLRFAPEMNGKKYLTVGNWFLYGQDPVPFRHSFRKLAYLVRNATNNTAMVWSPASGLGYPFIKNLNSPSDRQARFLALDTNLNGVLDQGDDPFTPYYPGDNFADWVGMSSYYSSGYEIFPIMKNNAVFVNSNMTVDIDTATNADSVENGNSTTTTTTSIPQLTNAPVNPAFNNFESQFSNPVFNFYKSFGNDKKKPVLINTGAAFFLGDQVVESSDRVGIKGDWSNQILNREFLKNHHYIKGIVFSDFRTLLDQTSFQDSNRYPDVLVDYGISVNTTVLSYYQDAILSLMKNRNGTLDSVLAFASSLDFNLSNVMANSSLADQIQDLTQNLE